MATATKAAPKAKAVEETRVSIPRLKIETFSLTLVGDSPLIIHRFAEKAKREMLDKQQGKASTGKQPKDPFRDYVESMYWLSPMPAKPTDADIAKAKFGFPSIAFKAAAVDAAVRGADLFKTEARAAFHIPGEMVAIIGHPRMREDTVKIGQGKTDLRYRGEFADWSAKVDVRFNSGLLTMEQIVNLFNIAGFSTGVGEWRPQRGGSNGMFHVEIGE